jgi:hypothetical protein
MQIEGVVMGKMVPAQAGGGQIAVTSQVMDLAVIMRNVRDLAKTASFSHMKDLEELHQLAYQNLKAKMVVDENGVPGVLMADPQLCMEAFKLISGVLMQTVETKRKAADTLLKARTLLDPTVPVVPEDDDYEDDPFDGEGPDGAVIQEEGVFGGVIKAGGVSEGDVVSETDPDDDPDDDPVVDDLSVQF